MDALICDASACGKAAPKHSAPYYTLYVPGNPATDPPGAFTALHFCSAGCAVALLQEWAERERRARHMIRFLDSSEADAEGEA